MRYDITGNEQKLLSIYITSKGFSFAYFEKATKIVDWGNVYVASGEFVKKVEETIDAYNPKVVILEDHKRSKPPRCKRANKRLDSLCGLCKEKDLFFKKYSNYLVKGVFDCFGSSNKYESAMLVSQWLPELQSGLPARPRVWQRKSDRMGVFEAVFLAIAYYYTV